VGTIGGIILFSRISVARISQPHDKIEFIPMSSEMEPGHAGD
jgi:hypothetical protein